MPDNMQNNINNVENTENTEKNQTIAGNFGVEHQNNYNQNIGNTPPVNYGQSPVGQYAYNPYTGQPIVNGQYQGGEQPNPYYAQPPVQTSPVNPVQSGQVQYVPVQPIVQVPVQPIQPTPQYVGGQPEIQYVQGQPAQQYVPTQTTPVYPPMPGTPVYGVPAGQPPIFVAPQPQNAPRKPKVIYLPKGFTPEKYIERKNIRRIALAAGISFLCFFAVSILWGELLGLLCTFLGVDVNDLTFLNNPAVSQLLQVILSSFAFTVPYIIVFKKFGFRIGELITLKKTEKGLALPMFFFGAAFCAFANIAISYFFELLSFFGLEFPNMESESPEGIFGFLLSVLATAVTPALVEEFAFRGIVLGSLKKYGQGFAVMVTAITFGIMHGNLSQIPFAFLVGLFLGFSTIKTGSMRVAIAVHFYNNFLSVLFEYFPFDLTELQINVIYVIILTLALLAGIFCMRLKRISSDFFSLTSNNEISTTGEKFKWFFTCPIIIVFCALSLAECIALFLVF